MVGDSEADEVEEVGGEETSVGVEEGAGAEVITDRSEALVLKSQSNHSQTSI